MTDRLTPLQLTILHALRDGQALTADEVFRRLGLVRPDTVEPPVATAVRLAVARGLERLRDEGELERLDGDAPRYALAGVHELRFAPSGSLALAG